MVIRFWVAGLCPKCRLCLHFQPQEGFHSAAALLIDILTSRENISKRSQLGISAWRLEVLLQHTSQRVTFSTRRDFSDAILHISQKSVETSTHPQSHPYPSYKYLQFMNRMGLRMDNGIPLVSRLF